jgi:hypothetical protein
MRRVAISLALLAPLPAHAARVAPHGKVRVHVDTEVFAFSNSRAIIQGIEPLRTNVIGVGVGRPVTLDGALGLSVIGLGVGYGVHRHLLLGARFGFNYNSVAVTSGPTAKLFVGTLMPYLEILPVREGPLLPFILLRTGVTGGDRIQDDGETFQRNDAVAPLAGVGLGMHGFIGRHFSLDLALTFDYRWHFTASRQLRFDPQIWLEQSGWQYSSRGFTLAATLGLSTWF